MLEKGFECSGGTDCKLYDMLLAIREKKLKGTPYQLVACIDLESAQAVPEKLSFRVIGLPENNGVVHKTEPRLSAWICRLLGTHRCIKTLCFLRLAATLDPDISDTMFNHMPWVEEVLAYSVLLSLPENAAWPALSMLEIHIASNVDSCELKYISLESLQKLSVTICSGNPNVTYGVNLEECTAPHVILQTCAMPSVIMGNNPHIRRLDIVTLGKKHTKKFPLDVHPAEQWLAPMAGLQHLFLKFTDISDYSAIYRVLENLTWVPDLELNVSEIGACVADPGGDREPLFTHDFVEKSLSSFPNLRGLQIKVERIADVKLMGVTFKANQTHSPSLISEDHLYELCIHVRENMPDTMAAVDEDDIKQACDDIPKPPAEITAVATYIINPRLSVVLQTKVWFLKYGFFMEDMKGLKLNPRIVMKLGVTTYDIVITPPEPYRYGIVSSTYIGLPKNVQAM